MRIGIISDPHGCLVGLESTVNWLEAAGIDRIVCAGDVAAFGPQPNECIALLAERNILTVQGNCDRDILVPPAVPSNPDDRTAQLAAIDAWCRERLTGASRAWLAALPRHLTPAPGLLVVHGGLNDPDEIVDRDAYPLLPPGVSAVAAGHLHVPFVIHTRQGLWVNAGSAGRPCDGDSRAALAQLERRFDGWIASVHRLAFDLDAAEQAIRRSGMPYPERMIETQRKACWW